MLGCHPNKNLCWLKRHRIMLKRHHPVCVDEKSTLPVTNPCWPKAGRPRKFQNSIRSSLALRYKFPPAFCYAQGWWEFGILVGSLGHERSDDQSRSKTQLLSSYARRTTAVRVGCKARFALELAADRKLALSPGGSNARFRYAARSRAHRALILLSVGR